MAYGLDTSQMLQAFGQLQQSNAAMRQRKDAAAAKRRGGISAITSTAGTVIGGIYGGPMGAAAGGAIGGAVGGMVGGNQMTAQEAAGHGMKAYAASEGFQAGKELEATNNQAGAAALKDAAPGVEAAQQAGEQSAQNIAQLEEIKNQPMDAASIDMAADIPQMAEAEQGKAAEAKAVVDSPIGKAYSSFKTNVSSLNSKDKNYEKKVGMFKKAYEQKATNIAQKNFVSSSGNNLSGDKILEGMSEDEKRFVTPAMVQKANASFEKMNANEGQVNFNTQVDTIANSDIPAAQKIKEINALKGKKEFKSVIREGNVNFALSTTQGLRKEAKADETRKVALELEAKKYGEQQGRRISTAQYGVVKDIEKKRKTIVSQLTEEDKVTGKKTQPSRKVVDRTLRDELTTLQSGIKDKTGAEAQELDSQLKSLDKKIKKETTEEFISQLPKMITTEADVDDALKQAEDGSLHPDINQKEVIFELKKRKKEIMAANQKRKKGVKKATKVAQTAKNVPALKKKKVKEVVYNEDDNYDRRNYPMFTG